MPTDANKILRKVHEYSTILLRLQSRNMEFREGLIKISKNKMRMRVSLKKILIKMQKEVGKIKYVHSEQKSVIYQISCGEKRDRDLLVEKNRIREFTATIILHE